MQTNILSIIAVLSIAAQAICQIASETAAIAVGVKHKVVGAVHAQQFGDTTLIELAKDAQLEAKPVGVVKCIVSDTATKVRIKASDASRMPVEVRKLADGYWMIDGVGKVWVEVRVVNLSKEIWDEQEFVIDIGEAVEPGPGPGPGPGPSSKYGLAKVVQTKAPKDLQSAQQYASVYKAAGEYLYGRPSLKFVESSNSKDNANPDKNVLAWIVKEHERISAASVHNTKWDDWHDALAAEFSASQKRQKYYTREDWYSAFAEVSAALQQIK